MRKLLALIILLALTLSIAAQSKISGTVKVGGTITSTATGGGACSFPCTSLLDDFNRTNEGPPPSANWTTGVDGSTGGFAVSSNTAVAQDGSFSSAYWNATTFGPDTEVYVTMVNTFGASCCGYRLYLRLASAGTSGVDGYIVQAYNRTDF